MPKGIGYGEAGKASKMGFFSKKKKKAKKKKETPIARKRRQMKKADPSLTEADLDRVLPHPKGKK